MVKHGPRVNLTFCVKTLQSFTSALLLLTAAGPTEALRLYSIKPYKAARTRAVNAAQWGDLLGAGWKICSSWNRTTPVRWRTISPFCCGTSTMPRPWPSG